MMNNNSDSFNTAMLRGTVESRGLWQQVDLTVQELKAPYYYEASIARLVFLF